MREPVLGVLVTAALGLCVTGLAPASAQDVAAWRVEAGAGLVGHAEQSHLAPVGLHLQAGISHAVSSAASLHLDTSISHFPQDVDHLHAPCRPGQGTFDCHPTTSPAGFWRTTGGLSLALGSLRAVGGAGVYHQYRGDDERTSWDPGFYLGLGIPIRDSAPRLRIDAQFHRLVDVPFEPDWFVPVSVTVAF